MSLGLAYVLASGNSCILQSKLSAGLTLVNHNFLIFYVVGIPVFRVWQPSAHTFKFLWV